MKYLRKPIVRILALVIVGAGTLSTAYEALAQTPPQTRQTREEYVERYKHIAIAHKERYGIPASIIMAQGILESDSGNSILSLESNNHFGIKCKSNWTGRKVYYDDDEAGECFRAYPSVEDSYVDHAEYLDAQPRYDSLFRHDPTDYKSWARGLKAAGYATAPDYAERLIRIIEEMELYLLDREEGDKLFAGRTPKHVQIGRTRKNPTGEVDPDRYRTTVNIYDGYGVARNNGVYYIRAKSGDTFEKLGEQFRLTAGSLRRFNEVSPGTQPTIGDIVYLGRKQKHRIDEPDFHVVRGREETLWQIGQRYAIRTRSLATLNRMPLSEQHTFLDEGLTVLLR